jgi:hypothetical protein
MIEGDKLQRAKNIMGKVDPALLSTALSGILREADEAEEADVAKAKRAIENIYNSIPEDKDRTSIVSKAIRELDADISKKEVKAIMGDLAGIDKKTIMEAAKDYLDIVPHMSCVFLIDICKTDIGICGKHRIGICPIQICSTAFLGIPPECHHHCLHYGLIIPDWRKWIIPDWDDPNPWAKEQFMKEIIQELLERPELSRAMRKMLKEISREK